MIEKGDLGLFAHLFMEFSKAYLKTDESLRDDADYGDVLDKAYREYTE
ncbi:hypothetical protein LCGC14_0411330 [marine sediment metagenome]|uniref:Uncharacterized protein n=1 Tax=marine sediment metagenome TaxID=412755 RepID=A0A0F9STX3_9ZZZZ